MQGYLAMIIPVDSMGGGRPGSRPPVDPGWGGGWGGGDYPSHGLPGAPGHPLPPIHHPGHPDHGLPSAPGHPGGGPIFHPGHPDHGLPSAPGHPDHGQPGGGRPDNSLPWAPGLPDNTLPGAAPKVYQAKVPPTPPESVNTEEGVWVIVNVNGALAWAWAQKPPQVDPKQ